MTKITDEQKQEIFETIELPTLIKNSQVPSIMSQYNTPLFVRELNRILIHFYLYNILIKRNLFEDILNFFNDANNINEITIFDNDAKKINFYLKRGFARDGLFIMPMRYDDEDEESTINDNNLHYTVNSVEILKKNHPEINSEINERTMHFYTIVDTKNNNTYLPAFTSKREIEKMYATSKFGYCMASYSDLIKESIPYNGIVINPVSLSIILGHNILDKIAGINLE